MDLGTAIIALIVILACIIPFIIATRKNRMEKKQFLKTLNVLAEKNGANISQRDVWSTLAIGLDGNSNLVFFIRKIKDRETVEHVNLSQIQKCRVINLPRTINNVNGEFKMVDIIQLAFSYRDKNQPETVLEFYNYQHDGPTLSGQIHLAEKWCKVINSKVSLPANKRN